MSNKNGQTNGMQNLGEFVARIAVLERAKRPTGVAVLQNDMPTPRTNAACARAIEEDGPLRMLSVMEVEMVKLERELVAMTKLAAENRLAGREEAVQIILLADAEDPFDSARHSAAIGDTGDYSVQWDAEKLREIFDCKPGAMASRMDQLEGLYWEHCAEVDGLKMQIAELTSRAEKAERRVFDLEVGVDQLGQLNRRIIGRAESAEKERDALRAQLAASQAREQQLSQLLYRANAMMTRVGGPAMFANGNTDASGANDEGAYYASELMHEIDLALAAQTATPAQAETNKERMNREWELLKADLRPNEWNVSEASTYYGFFCHGWYGRTNEAAYQQAARSKEAQS